MRLIIHILVAIMVVAILGGVAFVKMNERSEQSTRDQTHSEIRRFQQQVHLQTALAEEGEEAEERPPETIDPTWFAESVPRNLLFESEHPWVEIAGSRDRGLRHPPNPIATDESVAVFWYNPYLGIVRGRVPQQVSDSKALELYNEINDSVLTTLFADASLSEAPDGDDAAE